MKKTACRVKTLLLALLLTAALAGCGAADSGKPVPLTEEEIAQMNEVFSTVGKDGGFAEDRLDIACFYTSTYASPEEINLAEFLAYCPLGTVLDDTDGEEFRAVGAALPGEGGEDALPSDFPVPVHRFRKEDISALLERCAGVTADDLTITDDVTYLEEYGCFYNFTSDFGPGSFTCGGGERLEDTVRLWSGPYGEDESARKVLTLRKDGDSWLIASFQWETENGEDKS